MESLKQRTDAHAEHEYFIWDRRYFPHPEEMQASLAEKGRKVCRSAAGALVPLLTALSQLVAIVDPHIKRDPELYIYTEAQELDILSKTPDGKEFEGWCWTGNSAWTDWLHPSSWQWWIGQFTFEKFKVRLVSPCTASRDLIAWD